MAYQTPITIRQTIENIQKGEYVLPSIQREFVWQTHQIESLFDSLMRDYPIGTFLYWVVNDQNVRNYQFYKFIQHFHAKDHRHNEKLDTTFQKGVTAILDGQQRLTSIYIGVAGSFAEKLPNSRWSNQHAFPKKKLYLNLLSTDPHDDYEYSFVFLTDEEAKLKQDEYYASDDVEDFVTVAVWYFPVNNILNFTGLTDVLNYLMTNGLTDTSKFSGAQTQFALNALSKLYSVVHEKGIISYYEERGERLDKVLQIFIRVNSGGTPLSYSDLLLSVASAQWNTLDAREEIHSFVDEINAIGSGFNFNKDFVMKSFLVLGDFPDVVFKVDNFTRDNMLKIEQTWPDISQALRTAVLLLSRIGFSRDNLTSINAVIPIAYYIMKNQLNDSLSNSMKYAEDRKKIKEWLVRSLTKRVFGSAADSIYSPIRKVLTENLGSFPLERIIEQFRGTAKSISFSQEDIDGLVELEYSNKNTFAILSMLYDGINMNYNYHVDHIQPRAMFTDAQLKKMQFDKVTIEQFQDHFNYLPNLMLLEDAENVSKSKKPFAEWLEAKFADKLKRNTYLQSQFIPVDAPLEFNQFYLFYKQREQELKYRLKAIFRVN